MTIKQLVILVSMFLVLGKATGKELDNFSSYLYNAIMTDPVILYYPNSTINNIYLKNSPWKINPEPSSLLGNFSVSFDPNVFSGIYSQTILPNSRIVQFVDIANNLYNLDFKPGPINDNLLQQINMQRVLWISPCNC